MSGAIAAAVEASMFGQAASTLDLKSAQKPSRATDGRLDGRLDGIAIDGSVTLGDPLEDVPEQAATARTAAPVSPRIERRIDMTRPQQQGGADRRARRVPIRQTHRQADVTGGLQRRRRGVGAWFDLRCARSPQEPDRRSVSRSAEADGECRSRSTARDLWFDVDGPALVPDGPQMRERPTVVLVHGGPASYDHSYFKPGFTPLTERAQVVYLDLRDHGRSGRTDPAAWSFEQCADDVRAFCDVVGIARPIVLGHSMGGFVAMLYGARTRAMRRASSCRGRWRASISTAWSKASARPAATRWPSWPGATTAARAVTDAEWARVFAAFGPNVPDPDALARRTGNPAISAPGFQRFQELDVVAQLGRIDRPTLVCVGALDGVTPPDASREIIAALAPGIGRLEVIEGVGHFPWLDAPERYWSIVGAFVDDVAAGRA